MLKTLDVISDEYLDSTVSSDDQYHYNFKYDVAVRCDEFDFYFGDDIIINDGSDLYWSAYTSIMTDNTNSSPVRYGNDSDAASSKMFNKLYENTSLSSYNLGLLLSETDIPTLNGKNGNGNNSDENSKIIDSFYVNLIYSDPSNMVELW